MTDDRRKRFLNGAHYAAFGDVMMDPRENNAIVRRIIDLCMDVERETAKRCAEIAKTAEQYGACPHCAIADEFGMVEERV